MSDFLQSTTLTRHGLVLVNKPAGLTSHDIVHQARKIFQTKKIGHSGTLDPFSKGLLLLLVGEVVSLQPYFMIYPKVYQARFKLGMTTNTLDPTGKVTEEDPDFVIPPHFVIQDKIRSEFMGDITQVPPVFSAIKVGGRRAYTLARKGEDFAIPKRKIHISKFDILSIVDRKKIDFRIACGSGTYIRALANDLARSLRTVGMVESLIREKIGIYDLSDAIDLEQLQGDNISNDSFKELHKKYPGIIPMNILINRENFLKGICINCSWEELFKAKNGNFSFSLFKRQQHRKGVFHLTHKNTVLMIVEKRGNKTKILFNLLKYINL